jgi:hypothetical protein
LLGGYAKFSGVMTYQNLSQCAGRPAMSSRCKPDTRRSSDPHRPRAVRGRLRRRQRSVGRGAHRPASPGKIHIPGVDAVAKAEGDTDGRVTASAWRTRRGRRTWHVWKLVAREPGGPTPGQSQGSDLVCIGKARSHSR